MEKNLKRVSLTAVASALVFSTAAIAAPQTGTFSAGVTVQNAFTLTKDADLDFGTIRATAHVGGTDVATVVLSPNPATAPTTTGTANALTAVLVPGTPGAFTVSGVSPFATMAISDPTETDITAAAAPAGTAIFELGTWAYYITSGNNPNVAYNSTTPNLQADASGEVSFNVGATLSTEASATADYIDGAYSGSFSLSVDYN